VLLTNELRCILKHSGVSKYFPGHIGRAIYLAGIPDCCTKTQLKTAILTALTSPESNRYDIIGFKSSEKTSPTVDVEEDKVEETAIELIPDRIVISPPQWTKKGQYLHERSAWVIMSTAAQAQLALKLLKNLVVSIRDHEKITSEVTEVIYEFTLLAKLHTPKIAPFLSDALSHSNRVFVDEKVTQELASLLDEERNVSVDNRLSAILDETLHPEVAVALSQKPTSTLDLSIAYLRRVHFVDFYRGRKFRDEAHLLSVASGISYRSIPFIFDSNIDNTTSITSNESKQNVDAGNEMSKDVICNDVKPSELPADVDSSEDLVENLDKIDNNGDVDSSKDLIENVEKIDQTNASDLKDVDIEMKDAVALPLAAPSQVNAVPINDKQVLRLILLNLFTNLVFS